MQLQSFLAFVIATTIASLASAIQPSNRGLRDFRDYHHVEFVNRERKTCNPTGNDADQQDCPAGHWCAFLDEVGHLLLMPWNPSISIDIWVHISRGITIEPVCSTFHINHNFHSSRCIFQKSGRPIEGQCPDPKKVQAGTCLKVTRACNKMFRPVCGCDGKTYSNYSCTLGHNIKHEGHCCWHSTTPRLQLHNNMEPMFWLYRLVSVTCWWVSLEWMFLNWNTATTVSLKLLQSSILQSPHFRVVTAHILIQSLTNINDAAYFRPIIWTAHDSFHQWTTLSCLSVGSKC